MSHAPRPLTPVLLMHQFVERVQLWANSDHRQGPGPGVRSDFITPHVRARRDSERGGQRLMEKCWGRRMTGGDEGRRRKEENLGYFAVCESCTSEGVTGQIRSN